MKITVDYLSNIAAEEIKRALCKFMTALVKVRVANNDQFDLNNILFI